MEPTNQPDKFGLIVQCRANMDGLLMNELQTFASKILERLPMDQLKAFVFIGLNGIKKKMESAQLLAIKSSMHEIVQKSKKKKNANKKQDENPIAEADVDSQSMTRLIPEQVISSNICPFLLMPEICELAQVDRSLCIIAHTPSSLSNLCIRHDPYRFVSNAFDNNDDTFPIDGNFSRSFLGGLHRFRNVEKLSLCHMYHDHVLCNLCFPKAKHLTLAGIHGNFPCLDLPSMPSLTSIVFEGSSHTDDLLDFLKRYKAASSTATESAHDSADIQKEKPYFQDPIYNVKSIAIVNCRFHDLYPDFEDEIVQFERYQSICKFLLPSQPNQLKVLKLEASYFTTTDNQQYCDEWNAQFVDLERITSSLSGLEGFVYSQYYTELEPEFNQFHQLSKKLLSHKNSFPHLRSIHVHSPTLLNSLLCGTLIANSYSNFTATPISELCVTIPIHASPEFLSKLKTICTKLTKCCLVFHVKETKSDFATLCADILRRAKKLKLFQLVLIVDDDSEDGDPTWCSQLNTNVVQFSNALMTELRAISTPTFSALHAQRPFLFKIHIKSMHRTLHPKCKREMKGFSEIIKNLILTYLLTFCSGVIQCKLSQNHWHDDYYQDDLGALSTEMRALELLLDADVTSADIDNLSHLGNKSESCNTEKDYAYYAISARSRQTNSEDCNLEYDKRWNTDCEYCCNTPWL